MNTNKIYKVGAALAMSSMCSVTSFANSSIIQATNAVNMRSGPGMSYKVLDVIPDNAKVEYISTKGNWIKVKYDGKIGYSYKSYFNLKVESNKKEGVISVGTSRLNIRKQPTTTSYIMGKLYTGDKVTIVGESGDWYKIKTKNGTGYISKRYVKLNSSSSEEVVKKLQATVNCNVRSGPSTSYSVVGYLKKGEKINVKRQCDNGWYQVVYNKKTAYISNKCLGKITSGDTSSDKDEKVKQVKVDTNSSYRLNIRKGASTSSAVILSIKNGTVVEQLSKSGLWTKIKYNNIEGYCYSKYLVSVDSKEVSIEKKSNKPKESSSIEKTNEKKTDDSKKSTSEKKTDDSKKTSSVKESKKEDEKKTKEESTKVNKKEDAKADKEENTKVDKKEDAKADKEESSKADKKEDAKADKEESTKVDKKEDAKADKKEDTKKTENKEIEIKSMHVKGKSPVITCRDCITINKGYDATYKNISKLLNIKVSDSEDGDLTKEAKIIGVESIDTSKRGQYKVTVKVSDSDKNLTAKMIDVVVI